MGLGCCASSRAGSNLVRARLGLGLGLDSSNLRMPRNMRSESDRVITR